MQSPYSGAGESLIAWTQPGATMYQATRYRQLLVQATPGTRYRQLLHAHAHKKPSEENSLWAGSLTQEMRQFNLHNLNQRASSIFPQPEEVQTSVSCFSRKFPNHQAKA